MPALFDVTLDDMIEEVRRELKLRGKAYPRMIARGQLTTERAARQMDVLNAVFRHLRGQKERPADEGRAREVLSQQTNEVTIPVSE